MKPTKCPAREKKMRQEKRKKRGGEKAKSKSQDCCVTFKPKNYDLKICFLHMPELPKLISCTWIRRLQSVRFVNGLVVKFQNAFFGKISRGKWVNFFFYTTHTHTHTSD